MKLENIGLKKSFYDSMKEEYPTVDSKESQKIEQIMNMVPQIIPLRFKLASQPVGIKKPAILTNDQKEWDGNLIPTSKITEFTYPFEFLNPPQSQFFVNRFLDVNFIIQAATSAGKTVVAELARNGKFLYLSPLKAISQEKRDDWSDPKHAWSKLNVSISTGDYMLTPDRVEEMRRADIIVMTSEMLDSRSRNMQSERNDWLLDIDTLVIDEVHLLAYKGRGDKLESAIIRFTDQNPKCRLICLSATMPNIDEIANWLTKLNGKRTVIIKSDYRPVILHRHYEVYTQTRNYTETEEIKIGKACSIVRDKSDQKFIVFVHSKNTGHKVLNRLKEYGIKSEFHNADLEKNERIRIQTEFNSKAANSLRAIVATSTLAWGVNTPADSVILVGLHRGLNNLIANQDVHQMCGRAGRVGKTSKPEGHSYILVPHLDTDKFIAWCDKISDIKSRMILKNEEENDEGLQVLCFHIIAEVLGGYITEETSLLKWYERTLARYQGVELSLDDAKLLLDTLEKIKMVKKTELGTYQCTGLGKVSAYLYYSPFDIYGWYKNFLRLKIDNIELNDVTLGWALANIDSFDIGYVPQPAQMDAERYRDKLRNYGLDTKNQIHICAAAHHLLAGTENFPAPLLPFKRMIQADYGRINQALSMIDNLYARFGYKETWEQLSWQIRYGIGKHLIELVKLPQIGAKRANSLYDNGIKTKEDFLKKSQICRGVIGSILYDKILGEINQ